MIVILSFLLILFTFEDAAFAYIGPGAGFVFVSSFFVLFISFLLSFLSLLLLPFRFIIKSIKFRKKVSKTNTKRVIVIGFDGMDPDLAKSFMAEGKLPNFLKLKNSGSFSKLQTTNPPISPVAWSSFATGTNPAKHNIFDFLTPDRKTYLANLSSVDTFINTKHIKLGKYKIPLKKPKVSLLQKSKTFWKILGEHGIYSIILRVPITYPPEKFFGSLLSGMCVPDVSGTQGTFSFYSTDEKTSYEYTGGEQINVTINNNKIETYILGPFNPFLRVTKRLKSNMQIVIKNKDNIKIKVGGKSYSVSLNKYTEWIEIPFKAAPGIKIMGIAKFYLKSVFPEFEMYVTPVNLDPENSAQPISMPKIFSIYLSKLIGKFATLGLAEDTWALNEAVIDEKTFWEQAVGFHKEREKMFFHSLKKIKRGSLVCVFGLTDRIQHMFMRYLDSEHPANEGKDTVLFKNAVENSYKLADDIIGEILEKIDDSTALIVISDHGFKQFKRGFNLNTWLFKKGYLSLKSSSQKSGEWFESVDWKNTKAYGIGLSGLYINQKGRESQGIVDKDMEKKKLLIELKDRLQNIKDEKTGKQIIKEVYITSEIYEGPYKENAPDLLIGYYHGYRISWDSVIGKINGGIIEDNLKRWSGDHCIDPEEVPGLIFSNRNLESNEPKIIDISPSVLRLLGITPPSFIDGKPIISDIG